MLEESLKLAQSNQKADTASEPTPGPSKVDERLQIEELRRSLKTFPVDSGQVSIILGCRRLAHVQLRNTVLSQLFAT
jgi:hypothetical protein